MALESGRNLNLPQKQGHHLGLAFGSGRGGFHGGNNTDLESITQSKSTLKQKPGEMYGDSAGITPEGTRSSMDRDYQTDDQTPLSSDQKPLETAMQP